MLLGSRRPQGRWRLRAKETGWREVGAIGRPTCGGASTIFPLRRSLNRAVSATVAGALVSFLVGFEGLGHTWWPVGAGTRASVGAHPQPTRRDGGDTGGGARADL